METSVLVFVEQRDGKPNGAALQLFQPARELAEKLGGAVGAVVVGSDVASLAPSLAEFGADTVLVADDPALALYRAQPYTRALSAAVETAKPKIVLMATTFMGRDLAPRLAVRSRGALATDCVGVTLDEGVIRVTRSLYSGKCFGTFALDPERLRIISIRPNTFVAPARQPKEAQVARLDLQLTENDTRLETLEVVRSAETTKDVTEADVIVAGGRALKSEENFKILYDLAAELDAAVGASRAACDAGYQPHARQIGLTGKVVTPRLYIACGIDGAIQHLAGMRGSKVIVAINTKRDAPICAHATYTCCVDLFDLVPLLTEELRRIKRAH